MSFIINTYEKTPYKIQYFLNNNILVILQIILLTKYQPTFTKSKYTAN